MTVEHVGGIGLDMQGSIFEGTVSDSWMNANEGGGASFAHSANGGVASAPGSAVMQSIISTDRL